MQITLENIIDSGDTSIYDVRSKAPGASGTLPLTAEMLLHGLWRPVRMAMNAAWAGLPRRWAAKRS